MQTLGQAIKARNQAGYLGLIPCLIPGFPDVEQSLEMTKFLDDAAAVTALEFTLPAEASFSGSANQTIIAANRQAVPLLAGINLKAWLTTKSANFIMIYREALAKVTFATLVEQFTTTCAGIALEWEEKEPAPYWNACERAGMELVLAVHPEMSDSELTFYSQFIRPDGLVYLLCAPQAGGKPYDSNQLTTFAQFIKKKLPEAVLVASQGIATAADITPLAALMNIDAVVIGTAFFEAAEKGLPAVQAYLKQIEPALVRQR
jgi:tryptophan synthase alpha subunit